MSSELTPTKPKAGGMAAWLKTDEAYSEIEAALGETLPPDKFLAHMLVALREPENQSCTDQSKYRTVMRCASLSLVPTLGQVAMIRRKAKGGGPDELTAMVQWQGYKAVMERHPEVLEVQCFLVHISDAFHVEGGEPVHIYDPLDPKREFKTAADLIGGYARIIYRTGRPPKYHYMPRKAIEKAQACAQTQNVWKAWYYTMALKTLYRDVYARRAVPVDPLVSERLERIMKADDIDLGNDPMRITSEASQEHIRQAREARQAEPPSEPAPPKKKAKPKPDSQVDPDVDATEGVDEEPGEETSDTKEEYIADQLGRAKTKAQVNKAANLIDVDKESDGILDSAAIARLEELADNRRKSLIGT